MTFIRRRNVKNYTNNIININELVKLFKGVCRDDYNIK